MPIVAFAGDGCTTTAVAVAAAWPVASALVVEADPTGGDLAAWFDIPAVPSLSTVVTSAREGGWAEIERLTRTTAAGVRVIPAPAASGEAQQAVAESSRSLVPALAAASSVVAVVDTGRIDASFVNPFLTAASVTVVVHRQATQSARAAAVRLQRLASQLRDLTVSPSSLVVAMIGSAPFSPAEIRSLVASAVGEVPLASLPVDALSAAVYGGRAGVSGRRMARLPLARATRALAASIEQSLHPEGGRW